MRRPPWCLPPWSPPARPPPTRPRRKAEVRRSPPTSISSGLSCRPTAPSAIAISTNPISAPCRPRPTAASPAPIRRCRSRPPTPAFTVKRDGRDVLSRPAPADTADGRAWGGMLAELFAGSIDASPALQQTDRQALIRRRDGRHHQAARPQQPLCRPRGGPRQPLPARRRRRHRHHGRAHGRQEDPDPRRPGRLARGQGRRAGRRPDPGDRRRNRCSTGRSSDVVQRLRGTVGAPVTLTVLRPSQGREVTVALKRSRIIPTTVVYERRGDVALIHLMRLQHRHHRQSAHRHRQGAGRDRPRHGRPHHRHALQPRRPARPGAGGGRGVHRRRHHLLDPGPPSRQPRTYKSSTARGRKARRAAGGRADERRLGLGRRDRGGRAAGPRPRRRGRHAPATARAPCRPWFAWPTRAS